MSSPRLACAGRSLTTSAAHRFQPCWPAVPQFSDAGLLRRLQPRHGPRSLPPQGVQDARLHRRRPPPRVPRQLGRAVLRGPPRAHDGRLRPRHFRARLQGRPVRPGQFGGGDRAARRHRDDGRRAHGRRGVVSLLRGRADGGRRGEAAHGAAAPRRARPHGAAVPLLHAAARRARRVVGHRRLRRRVPRVGRRQRHGRRPRRPGDVGVHGQVLGRPAGGVPRRRRRRRRVRRVPLALFHQRRPGGGGALPRAYGRLRRVLPAVPHAGCAQLLPARPAPRARDVPDPRRRRRRRRRRDRRRRLQRGQRVGRGARERVGPPRARGPHHFRPRAVRSPLDALLSSAHPRSPTAHPSPLAGCARPSPRCRI